MFRNLPGARGNMGGYGRGMGPGRVVSGMGAAAAAAVARPTKPVCSKCKHN
jgi:hypothetical protein